MTLPLNTLPALDPVVARASAADETVFESALARFKDALEVLCIDNQIKVCPNLVKSVDIKIEFLFGARYVRVVRAEYPSKDGITQFDKLISRSAHAFIDRTNGDILKASGWSKPETKNPRGNIFADDPLQGVTVYGTVYLNHR